MYLTKKTLNFLTSNRSIKTVLGGHLELDDQVFTHGDEGHVGLRRDYMSTPVHQYMIT